jgi:hypothetical protein
MWKPGHDPSEVGERGPDLEVAVVERQGMNGPLVGSAPLLENRDGLPEFSVRLEIAEQKNRIGKIADVNGRIHATAHDAVMCERKNCRDPLLVQVGKQFMKLQDQKLFSGHRIEESVQAVDDKDSRMRIFDKLPNLVCELAGGDFRGIKLKHTNTTRAHVTVKLNALERSLCIAQPLNGDDDMLCISDHPT